MGSNSFLQECGLQQWWSPAPDPDFLTRGEEFSSVQWWSPPPDPDFLKGDEEFSSDQVTVTFYANLKDRQYKNVQKELRSFDIHYVSRDASVIHVTSYDAAVLQGQQVLDIFQKYDRHARRAT